MFSPLLVNIQPSVLGRLSIFALACVAFIGMAASAISAVFLVLLSLLLLLLLSLNWPRYMSLSDPLAIRALHWVADQKTADVQLYNGEWLKVETIACRLVTRYLIAAELQVECSQKRFNLLIWKDSIAPEAFRRMTVLMKYAPLSVSATHNLSV